MILISFLAFDCAKERRHHAARFALVIVAWGVDRGQATSSKENRSEWKRDSRKAADWSTRIRHFAGKIWSMRPCLTTCSINCWGHFSDWRWIITKPDLLMRQRHKEVFPVAWISIPMACCFLTNNGKSLRQRFRRRSMCRRSTATLRLGDHGWGRCAFCFEAGIGLKDFTTLPARLQIAEVNEANASSTSKLNAEGKFPSGQVAWLRLCGKKWWIYDSMGPLTLDPTPFQLGEWWDSILLNSSLRGLRVPLYSGPQSEFTWPLF